MNVAVPLVTFTAQGEGILPALIHTVARNYSYALNHVLGHYSSPDPAGDGETEMSGSTLVLPAIILRGLTWLSRVWRRSVIAAVMVVRRLNVQYLVAAWLS